MPNRLHRIRCAVVVVMLIGAFLALGAKLFHIQIVRHDFFVKEALALHERNITLYPARGRILDRRGKCLALSEPTKIICLVPGIIADPAKTKDPDALVARLAAILGKSPAEVAQCAFDEASELKYLQREASEEALEQIEALRADRAFFEDITKVGSASSTPPYEYGGIYLKDRVRRTYPNSELAAHVLGYVRHETSQDEEIEPAVRDDKYPVTGIELEADRWLHGRNGSRIKRMDCRRREVLLKADRGQPAVDGSDVVLTIDLNIQSFVEEAVARAADRVACDSITALVLRPQTGEILAWANRPTFDPNRLTNDTRHCTTNPGLEEKFEPGSTLKPCTAALALHYRTVTLESEFYCEHGCWRTPVGRVLHDAHAYDTLSVFDIIEKSSNIGIAKVAATLGVGPDGRPNEALAKERLYAGLRAFGFGQATGVRLPHESRGTLYPPSQWSGYSMTSLPMGHEIAVTPLQLALAYCAIANGGNLVEPRLIARLVDQNGAVVEEFPPKVVHRAISEQAARDIAIAMQAVVSREGTAPRADIPRFSQAGKTGTSHKVIDGRYSDTFFDSTFVGFAPVREPEVVILVTMRGVVKPNHYAGTVVAPVFAEIGTHVLEYLEVPPDEVKNEAHARAN